MATSFNEINKGLIKGFCTAWKIREFAIFGSALRDDFNDNSDIDVMISFQTDAAWSLLDHVTMRDELAEIMGRNVDLVTRKGVELSRNKYLKAQRSFMQNRDFTKLQTTCPLSSPLTDNPLHQFFVYFSYFHNNLLIYHLLATRIYHIKIVP